MVVLAVPTQTVCLSKLVIYTAHSVSTPSSEAVMAIVRGAVDFQLIGHMVHWRVTGHQPESMAFEGNQGLDGTSQKLSWG